MPENQSPVFTDNESIAGDGTVENPLSVIADPQVMRMGDATIETLPGPLALPAGVETQVWESQNMQEQPTLAGFGNVCMIELSAQIGLAAGVTKLVANFYIESITPDNLEFSQELDLDNTGPIITEIPMVFKGITGIIPGSPVFITLTPTGADASASNYCASAIQFRVRAGF